MRTARTIVIAALLLVTAVPCLAQTAQEDEVTQQLLEMEKRSEARMPPEFLKAGRDAEDEIRKSGILENALNVGAKMPEFRLNDAYGKSVFSGDLLKKGPVVLVFYRGAWCPYCNLYLRGLQKRLTDITSRGASLVAISVEPPDRSLEVLKKDKLEFPVLSDPDLVVAKKFGIVYTVPEELNEKYVERGLDLAKYNGTAKPELPLGVTYVIAADGTIEYAFLKTDYKKRAAPSDVIAVLDRLRAGTN